VTMIKLLSKHSRFTLALTCLAAILACFSVLPAATVHAAGETAGFPVNTFIKEVIAAYGGETHLSLITSVYATGSIEAFMRGDRGISTRYFKRPRKLRAELVYQKSSETRILNGFRGWRGNGGEPLREVHGPSYLAMAYQFKYLDLPFGFLDKGYKITYLGRETLHALPVEVLQLVDNEGTIMRVYIDAGTHLIVRVVGSFGIGPGGAELAAEFSDFRDVDGVKFPFRVTNYSGANKIAETMATEIRINKEMPESLFQP
jgi:hypothetical protein